MSGGGGGVQRMSLNHNKPTLKGGENDNIHKIDTPTQLSLVFVFLFRGSEAPQAAATQPQGLWGP